MGGKRKAEDEPEVDDDDDDEIISEEEHLAILAESRARVDKKCSEMFARLGIREDAGLRYDDTSSDDEEEEDEEEEGGRIMDDSALGPASS
jgi:hypothetical protein